MNVYSQVANSADGVPIYYDVQGSGATALVFVHGCVATAATGIRK